MRYIKILLLLACLGVVACESPTVPKYPDPEDEPPDDDDDPKSGFLLEGIDIFWV